jgi:trigger factor
MADATPQPTNDEAASTPDLPANTVEVEEAGTLKKKVTVTVPKETIDAKFNDLYGELSSTAQVPGFRIGRAPRRLLEKRFGKDVGDDVRNNILGEAIGQAIDEADLKTLGEPDLNLDEVELEAGKDMTFSFGVEVAPEFDLPETKGIAVERPPFEVDDEKIDQYLDNIRQGQARYETTEEPAAEGDAVTASAKITGEGIEHENPHVQLRLAPGVVEGLPLVDLAKDLDGVKAGDTVELKVTAPESHPTEEWQGKELTIELTAREIRRRILPEINDEMATSAGFDSLDEMRQYLGDSLRQRADQETQQSLQQQICDYLLENTEFDLPEGVVARHTQQVLQRQMISQLRQGMPQEKIKENLAELQARAEEQAVNDLKLSFILGKIAEEREIECNEAEINARVAQMAAMYNRRPERLRQELAADGTLEQVAVNVVEEKALDALLAEADITDKAPEDDKAEKKSTKKAAKKSAKKSEKDDAQADEKKTAKKSAKKTAKKKSSDK